MNVFMKIVFCKYKAFLSVLTFMVICVYIFQNVKPTFKSEGESVIRSFIEKKMCTTIFFYY